MASTGYALEILCISSEGQAEKLFKRGGQINNRVPETSRFRALALNNLVVVDKLV